MPDDLLHSDCRKPLPGSVSPKTCTNRRCPERGRPQPLTEFWPNKTCRDGLQAWCKTCLRRYGRERSSMEATFRRIAKKRGKYVEYVE
jgi:hypothetical protein